MIIDVMDEADRMMWTLPSLHELWMKYLSYFMQMSFANQATMWSYQLKLITKLCTHTITMKEIVSHRYEGKWGQSGIQVLEFQEFHHDFHEHEWIH
jgi:hypothetical protein